MKIINEINALATTHKKSKSDSYEWDNPKSKTTFPPTLWVSAILDVIYFEISTTIVEKKYTQKMPTIKRPSNNMYINSLLNKMEILSKPSIKLSDHFSEIEVENWIINRINEITDKKYEEATNSMRKLICEWRTHYADSNSTLELDEAKLATIAQELKKRVFSNLNSKWNVVEELDDNIVRLDFKSTDAINFNISNKEKIGKLGESLFHDMLIMEFGAENVVWESNNNKFSPYDFEVEINGTKRFFEVKTTTKSSKSFFISGNELAFRKSVKNYSLVTITNIPTNIPTHFPNVIEVRNPEFEISMDRMGVKDNKIILTPTHFKGII